MPQAAGRTGRIAEDQKSLLAGKAENCTPKRQSNWDNSAAGAVYRIAPRSREAWSTKQTD
jgi:hypothetical protein